MRIITDHKNNAFNLARLLASTMVLYGHSLSVGPSLNPTNDILFIIFGVSSASLAVKFFFVLSGMLVCTSLIKNGDWKTFIIHRAFRIYPGLICALLFVVLIVSPIVSDINFFGFITNKETISYFTKNLTFQTFGEKISLPMIQVGKWTNMNEPLWTLAPEVGCYLFMLSVFLLTFGNRFAITVIALLVILDCLLPSRFLLQFLPSGYDDFSYLPLFFAIGALFGLYRSKLYFSFVYVLLYLLVFAFFSSFFKGAYIGVVSKYLVLIFTILYFFTRPLVCKFEVKQDLSYGIYIYGWPIQMLTLYFLGNFHGYIHFFLPLAFALVMAYVSWNFIESPSIRLGRFLSEKISPGQSN